MKAFFTDGPISARLFWRLCLALFIVGLALRLPMLGSRSLWLDETYSAWFCALPLHELWTSVPLYETHPPFYYTLLKGWTILFGNSEAALRSMSVLASVATILLIALSGKALRAGPAGDRIALLAALFLAVNRGSVQYAQEARPYALESLAASATILFSLIVVRRLTSKIAEERSWSTLWPGLIGLGMCAGATLWLHNTAIFIVFGIWTGLTVSLLLLVRGRRTEQVLAIGFAGVLALLIWSPFIPMLIRESINMSKMSFWVSMNAGDLTSAWYLAAGGSPPTKPVLALCLVGAVAFWRVDRVVTLHAIIVLVLPLTVVLAYSYLVKPIYIARLFEWLAPSVMVLAAMGIWAGVKQPGMRFGATCVLLALCLTSTIAFYAEPTEDWRGLIDAVASQAEPGDAVIVYPNELNVVMHYYVQRKRNFPEIMYIPAPFPALGWNRKYVGNLGAPVLEPSDMLQVRAIKEKHRRIWLIQKAGHLYDHDNIVRNELTKNLTLVRSFNGKGSMKMALFE